MSLDDDTGIQSKRNVTRTAATRLKCFALNARLSFELQRCKTSLVTHLELFSQERQKLLFHELVAEYLGEWPDIAAKGSQGGGRDMNDGALGDGHSRRRAHDHQQLLGIPRFVTPACHT